MPLYHTTKVTTKPLRFLGQHVDATLMFMVTKKLDSS